MAPKRKYTPHQMGLAMEAVRKGAPIATTAKKYGVPRITLSNKVKGKTLVNCPMGPSTIMTHDEEKVIVEWLLAMAERHCPVGREQLLDTIQMIVKSDKRKTPFTDGRPGRKWFTSFLKRHPVITQRVSQNLTVSREAVTEEQIQRWFLEIAEYLKENNLFKVMKDPSRVFNTDESAFFLNPKPGHVLAKRGDKNVYSTSGNEKENLTVLLTANAAGQLAPPMIVFPYERIPKNISASIPDDWGVGRSESGWMCGSTFFEYVSNVFYPWLIENNIELPVLFFLDGHASHLTKHLSDFCSQHQIEVIALHPNSTHLLQPMDVAVFRPLKLFWRKHTRKWKTENLGEQIKKENFAPILKSALEDISLECIKNGFRAGGLFPFGPEFIDFTKLNVHNRRVTAKDVDSTYNVTLLAHLEKEIANIFTQSKLDLFEKCFYLHVDQLSDKLPAEDTTLYIVWAKYKHMCSVMNPGKDIQESSVTKNDDSQNLEQVISVETSQNMPKCVEKLNSPHQNPQSGDHTFKTSWKDLPSTSTNNDQDIEQLNHSSQDSEKDLSKFLPCASTSSVSFIENGKEVISPIPNSQQIEKTPSKDLPVVSTSTKSFADHMKISVNIEVPSPFKKALFWPENTSQKKKRISKEKIPSVVTSKAWKEYHSKKESQKIASEEEKEKKRQERLEKKNLKEKQKKNNQCKKRNTRKRRRSSITSSDNAESDVTYMETDDSVDVKSDEELIQIRKPNNSSLNDSEVTRHEIKTCIQQIGKDPVEKPKENGFKGDGMEDDNSKDNNNTFDKEQNSDGLKSNVEKKQFIAEPAVSVQKTIKIPDVALNNLSANDSSTSGIGVITPKIIVESLLPVQPLVLIDTEAQKPLRDIVAVDDYVFVTWNERMYPGQIISMSEEGVLVSCLKKGKQYWRWPVIKDIQLYDWDKVVRVIGIPKFAKKGCFLIPELNGLD